MEKVCVCQMSLDREKPESTQEKLIISNERPWKPWQPARSWIRGKD